MTKRELKTLAYGIGISEAHRERRIVFGSQSTPFFFDSKNGKICLTTPYGGSLRL